MSNVIPDFVQRVFNKHVEDLRVEVPGYEYTNKNGKLVKVSGYSYERGAGGKRINKQPLKEKKNVEKLSGKETVDKLKAEGYFHSNIFPIARRGNLNEYILKKQREGLDVKIVNENKYGAEYIHVLVKQKNEKSKEKKPKEEKPKEEKIKEEKPKSQKEKNMLIEDKHEEYQKNLLSHIGGDYIEELKFGKNISDDHPHLKEYIESIKRREFRYIRKNEIPKEIIAHNKKVLKEKNKSGFITVYRGANFTTKDDLVNVDHLQSWTDEWDDAERWADFNDGEIIMAKVPIDDVYLSYQGSNLLGHGGESEYIIDPKNVKIEMVENLHGDEVKFDLEEKENDDKKKKDKKDKKLLYWNNRWKKKNKKDFITFKKLDFTIKEYTGDMEGLVHDKINIDDFVNVSSDFNTEDFSVLTGPITRAGPFPYQHNGKNKTYYKKWNNIKDVFSKIDYLPLIGSVEKGAHHASTIGFAYNFKPNEQTSQMFADIITLKDMDELTNSYKPEGYGWEVSIGFRDKKVGNIQHIIELDHLAASLRNKEQGRCGILGDPCFMNYKVNYDQNLKEVS